MRLLFEWKFLLLEGGKVMYAEILSDKLNSLKESGQYREFVTINRICGQYPLAKLNGKEDEQSVVCVV